MEWKASVQREDLSLSDAWRRVIVGEPSVFSDVWAPPVPPVSTLTAEFIETWVKPFYLDLNRERFEAVLASRWREITPDLVWRLLSERNWRARVSGAYLAALRRFSEFEPHIGGHFLRSEIPYAGQGYCLALARIGNDHAVDVLSRYLDHYLFQHSLIYDQCAAMGALAHLDGLRGTDRFERFRPAWDRFVADKESIDLEGAVLDFARQMETLDALEALFV